MKFLKNWIWIIPAFCGWIPGCVNRSDGEGSAGGKVFMGLGICLAAVFLVFYIVVKGREKD